MIKEMAIKLNERWIKEIEVTIVEHEEKIAVLRNRIASHEERITCLKEEEVKADE